jgi:hypothetical protein
MKKAIELLEEALETMLQVTRIPEHYQEVAYIKEAIAELKARPRWETPAQWEKRTGKAWPDNWAVYFLNFSDSDIWWDIAPYWEIKEIDGIQLIGDKKIDFGKKEIVCATEAGPPPDAWKPEEE